MDITNNARDELKRIIGTYNLQPTQGFRLATPPSWEGEGDFGIVVDEERDGDHLVKVDGLKLLMIDPTLEKSLSATIMDFKDTSSGGPRFTLDVY